jgi:hypothetical protein
MRLSQQLADSLKPAAERAATPARQRRIAPPAKPPTDDLKLPDNVIPFRRK